MDGEAFHEMLNFLITIIRGMQSMQIITKYVSKGKEQSKAKSDIFKLFKPAISKTKPY